MPSAELQGIDIPPHPRPERITAAAARPLKRLIHPHHRREIIEASARPKRAAPNIPPDDTLTAPHQEPFAMSRRDPEKSVLVLDRMLQLLDGGAHWTRGVYDDGEGNFCLVGAMNQIRDDLRIRGAGTAYYLLRAIGGGRLLSDLEDYNDWHNSFAHVEAVILKARALAEREIGEERPSRRRRWRSPKITELDPLAVMAAPECAELARAEAADQRKRRLLAEIELERMARAAAGDTRVTYILCPEPPSNYRLSKVFAAAGDPPKIQSNRAREPETLIG
jgi:hypothetical protein